MAVEGLQGLAHHLQVARCRGVTCDWIDVHCAIRRHVAGNPGTAAVDINTIPTDLVDRIEVLTGGASAIYGADGVSYSDDAETKLAALQSDPDVGELGMCMVKTHLSLSHDPELKGRPTGWTLPIRDILVYKGAGFVVPVAGAIKLMPGTASNPAYRGIDVDVETGRVKGLF